MLHIADLPTADMAWLFTPTMIILVADRRVPRDVVVQTLRLGLTWRDDPPPKQPDRTAA